MKLTLPAYAVLLVIGHTTNILSYSEFNSGRSQVQNLPTFMFLTTLVFIISTMEFDFVINCFQDTNLFVFLPPRGVLIITRLIVNGI